MRRGFTAIELVATLAILATLGLIIYAAIASSTQEPLHLASVIQKRHEPERQWVQLIPISTGKTMMMIPVIHTDDEDWILVVRGLDSEGEQEIQSWFVSEYEYNQREVGDILRSDEVVVSLTDPHQKRRK